MSDESLGTPAVPPKPETAPLAAPSADALPIVASAKPQARRTALVLAALAGLVIGGGGVGMAWGLSSAGGDGADPTFVLRGTLTLTGDNILSNNGSSCMGTGGYDDIAAGTSVTVYDANGGVVATGALGDGSRDSTETTCSFPLSAADVPSAPNFFSVEISHRGKITISRADAEAGMFAATLG